MTDVLLLAQPVVFVAALWFVLRHASQREERAMSAVDRLAADANQTARRLIETIEQERDARRDEIQTLLQRIQAPQHAIVEHAVKHAGPEPDGMPRTERESAEATDEELRMRLAVEEIEKAERLMQEGLNLIPAAQVAE